MLHAALLLLMLEAANARPRFTISLKRSTQNLQLSTSSPADYPILFAAVGGKADLLPVKPLPVRSIAIVAGAILFCFWRYLARSVVKSCSPNQSAGALASRSRI